jgi:hypothetical protein
MRQAGLLEPIDPQGWNIPWNVHSQAHAKSHTAFTYLAPSVFRVAISTRRIVGRTDHPVTFTSRQPGSARPRATTLDVIECIRRFLHQVVPDGFMNVRHCGFRHASCTIAADTLCPMIVQAHPTHGTPTRIVHPEPLAALCPTCGIPRRLVMRLWTSSRACVDTG